MFVTPEAGSDLEFGQIFLDAFFFDADQEFPSALEFCPVFEFCGVAATVEVDELEFNEEEELDL